jgi:crossover junction endodeoxyribonuclease RuvC
VLGVPEVGPVIVAGLDLSLGSTGIGLIDTDRHLGFKAFRVRSVGIGGRGKETVQSRRERLAWIRAEVGNIICSYRPSIVFVEQPALGANSAYGHDISGNWWMTVDRLHDLGCTVVEVNNTKVKIYATGSGATSGPNKVEKKHVIAAVQDTARYGPALARQVDGEGSDVCDAFILAALGARLLGHPVELTKLPQTHLRALENIHLPEGFTCP